MDVLPNLVVPFRVRFLKFHRTFRCDLRVRCNRLARVCLSIVDQNVERLDSRVTTELGGVPVLKSGYVVHCFDRHLIAAGSDRAPDLHQGNDPHVLS